MLGVSLSLTFPLNQAWVPDWKPNWEVSKQPRLIWVFCSFCWLPWTAWGEPLYFRGNFVPCAVSASLTSCWFLLQSFGLLAVVSNVGYDSLGKRSLWVLYTQKSCYPYPLCPWRFWCPTWAALCSGAMTVLFLAWLGFGWQNLLNWVVSPHNSHLCLAAAFSWFSCNCLIWASNKWVVHLLGYIEKCSGSGGDGYYNWCHFLKAN